MIDIAPRHNRRKKICTVWNERAHSSQNIKTSFVECLNEYNMQLYQVVSVTTDNSANSAAISKIFNAEPETASDDDNSVQDNNFDEIFPNARIGTLCIEYFNNAHTLLVRII